MSIKKRKIFPVLKQRDMTECGTTCLAMIFKFYGLYNVQSILREIAHVSAEGTDLYTMTEVAQMFGFESDGYETSYEWLPKIDLPVICHYEGNHYVVVYKATADEVWLADPAFGKTRMSKDEFSKRWNGILMTVEPTELVFKNKDVMDLVAKRREQLKDVRRNFYVALLHPFKRVIWEILIATFVIQFLALALPLFTRTIVDQVIMYQDRPLLFAILAALVIIFFTRVLMTFGRNILLTQFKIEFELNFFSRFFDHFIHLNQKYFDGYKREDFINRFQENMKIRHLFSPGVLQSFLDVGFIFIYIIALFFINAYLALFVLAFVFIFFVLTIIFTPRLHNLEDKIFHESLKTMGTFLDTLLGIQTVKLLSLERLKFWQWKNKYRRALNKVLETQMLSIMLESTLQGLFMASRIGIYWIGAYLAFTSQITIGDYVAFIAIFTLIMQPVQTMSRLWFMIAAVMVTYDKLNDVFVQPREMVDLQEQRMTQIGGDIEIQRLTFRYRPNDDLPVLDDLSVKIPHGSHVAIVGRNGSGKTTLAKLLVKLYDHYEGRISLGGTEIRSIHPQALRKKVVMVPQDIYIFGGTIKENIMYANPDAEMKAVVQATTLACFDRFVHDNYLGYNYMVGESGSNLSGGQRLRLAFARLFMADPEVIILDEATSVLDVESEKIIMQNVRQRFPGKTIISIAHRMSTVKDADLILVIDEGRIIEQGDHETLLKQQGLYFAFMKTYLDF